MSTYDDIKLKIRGLQLLACAAELDCKLNMIIKHLGINEDDYPEERDAINRCEQELSDIGKKEKEIHEEEEKAKNLTPQDLMDALFGIKPKKEGDDGNKV